MTSKYIKLFQFMVCGKSIRICRHALTNLYYVQIRNSHAWQTINRSCFDTYQNAVDWASYYSASLIRSNSVLSPLS